MLIVITNTQNEKTDQYFPTRTRASVPYKSSTVLISPGGSAINFNRNLLK